MELAFSFFNRNPFARMSDREVMDQYHKSLSGGDSSRAEELADEMISRNNSTDGYYFKAQARRLVNESEAIPYMQAAISSLDPSRTDYGLMLPLLKRNLATLYCETGSYDEAIEIFDEMLSIIERDDDPSAVKYYMEDMDFFFYELAIRNKLFDNRTDKEREVPELRLKLINAYWLYIDHLKAEPDEKIREHVVALYDEISQGIPPEESNYC